MAKKERNIAGGVGIVAIVLASVAALIIIIAIIISITVDVVAIEIIVGRLNIPTNAKKLNI